MVREVQGAVLVLIGATVLRLTVGDLYVNYVKEGMRPLLFASGVVLVVLGAAALLVDTRRAASPEDVLPADHDHDSPRVAWLLVLPVVAVFLVAPPPLGSYAAGRDSGAVAAPSDDDFPPLTREDPVPLKLSAYAERAVWDEGRTLEGRTVRLTGFVTPGDGPRWYLTRIKLACCAADGTAVKVEVHDAAAPPADTWVRLTGTYRRGTADVAAVTADGVRPIPRPEFPYE